MLHLTCIYIILVSLLSCLEGRVNIIEVFQPLYVRAGFNLTLKCISDNRRELEWVHETPNTNWNAEVISPVIDGNHITRYLIEEPSGYVETVLIIDSMSLDDRGMYQCRDIVQENSFALWVTVIFISGSGAVASPNEAVDLYCSVTGFDSNLPYIDYRWYFNEQEIIESNHKYDLVNQDGVSQLTINDPVREDGGKYICGFTLQTNIKPVEFIETVTLDTSPLPSSDAASFHHNTRQAPYHASCILATVITTLLYLACI